MSKNPLKTEMPTLARHEGIWEGTYRHYDKDGNKTDEHHSRLICRFPEDGIRDAQESRGLGDVYKRQL